MPHYKKFNYCLLSLCLFFTSSVWAETLTVTSTAFLPGAMIPQQYSCHGADISPPLSWQGAPKGTQSFALIMNDPDAPNRDWVHWLLINIPANINQLPESMTSPFDGIVYGSNSWEKTRYNGPCPPSGTHHYYFNLYALDTVLNLPTGFHKADLQELLQQHTLATATLIGIFK